MDVLRARAYLDLLLGKDSRPRHGTPGENGDASPDEPAAAPVSGPQAGPVPAGFAGRVTLDPVTTDPCDHRHEASGHDPGVRLRHLSQARHATCTSPICRRPAATCDFEHNTPYEAGGRTCLCNGGPQCKR